MEQARVEADKSLKERYGLPTELALERADDPGTAAKARDEWARGRAARAEENSSRKRKQALEAPVLSAPSKRRGSTSTESAASSLRARILSNSARRTTASGVGAIDALIPPTSRKGASGGLAAGIALRKP